MATDDERRRVAAALREYASFDCECEDEEEFSVDCADWGERVINLLDCGDTEKECYAYLADLIDPDCGTAEAPTSRVPECDGTRGRLARALDIDLPALLALADEMRRNTQGMLSDDKVDASDIWYYEHLLRKACGESAPCRERGRADGL